MSQAAKLSVKNKPAKYCIDITGLSQDGYLPMESFYFENGMLCGPDPHLGKSLNLVLEERDTKKQAKTLKNVPLSELEEAYLSCDTPVAIWVTMEMKASTDGTTYLLENRNSFTWISGEHCMVLTGYDETRYYLLDSLADGGLVSYPKSLVEMRYQELGMQAVVIETVS